MSGSSKPGVVDEGGEGSSGGMAPGANLLRSRRSRRLCRLSGRHRTLCHASTLSGERQTSSSRLNILAWLHCRFQPIWWSASASRLYAGARARIANKHEDAAMAAAR